MASYRIRVHAPNQTELITTRGGVHRTIFFSYETPVIVKFDYEHGVRKEYKSNDAFEVYVTNKKHSVTTSKHINKYLEISHCETEYVPQDEIYMLSDMSTKEMMRFAGYSRTQEKQEDWT